MRFFVVGAGAVGSFFAGQLLAAAHTVTALARGVHLDAMRTRGLCLEDLKGRIACHGPVDICADLHDAPAVDVLIATRESHQLAAGPLAVAASRARLLVQTQNGVGWRYFQSAGGPHSGHVVRHQERASDKWVLGALEGSARSNLDALANAFTGAGLVTERGDARQWMWNKLLGNIFSNPVFVLPRHPLSVIARHPAARALRLQLMAEVASVSSAHGCRISMSFKERLDRSGQRASVHATGSGSRPSDRARRHPGRHRRTGTTRRGGNNPCRIFIGVFAGDRLADVASSAANRVIQERNHGNPSPASVICVGRRGDRR